MSLEEPFLNIFLRLKVRMKAKGPYFSNLKKKFFFKRLKRFCLKKKFPTNEKIAKNRFFSKNVFGSKMVKNDFFLHESGFIRKFGQFCEFLTPVIFFIRLLVLAVEVLENLHFLQIFKKYQKNRKKSIFFKKRFLL